MDLAHQTRGLFTHIRALSRGVTMRGCVDSCQMQDWEVSLSAILNLEEAELIGHINVAFELYRHVASEMNKKEGLAYFEALNDNTPQRFFR